MSTQRDPSIRRTALLLPVVVMVMVVLLASTACARNLEDPAGENRSPAGGSGPSPSSGSGPPTRFATAGQVRLPREAEGLPDRVLFGVAHLPLPLALSGTTAYVATHTTLLAVDVRSGRTVATVAPEHTAVHSDPRAAGWNPAAPPVLAERDGETRLVAPLLVTVIGGGPARSRTAVELVEVQPVTNQRLRSVTIDVDAVPTEPAPEEQWLAVVGVVGTVAVLRVGRTTYGVDLTLGARVWQKNGFTGATVVGDVVVGWFVEGATQRAAGLRAADGSRLWADRVTGTRLSIVTGGPTFAVLQGRAGASGDRYLHVVRATTGAVHPPRLGRAS